MQHVYEVAGAVIGCLRPLRPLAALVSDDGPIDLTVVEGAARDGDPGALVVFDGVASLGLRECRVRCACAPAADLLTIEAIGLFRITEDCIEIARAPGAGDDAIDEALLGPALALALARRGTFVLHASAVVLASGEAVGFLGDSGSGKSTLGQLLGGLGAPRAADDLLAVRAAGSVSVFSRYPQLKLDDVAMRQLARLPPRLPVAGLFALSPVAPAAAVLRRRLPAREATGLLVRHTIAAALFSSEQLAAHLDFAAGVAASIGVEVLEVPRRFDVATEVLRVIAADAAGAYA